MRKVELRMNELTKYDVIKDVCNHKIKATRASVLLQCTIRNIYKLKRIYRAKGKAGFVHGNRDKKPIRTFEQSIVDKIVAFYAGKYANANYEHFRELLEENEGIKISYNALYRLLKKAGYISPMCQRKTKRAKNKELREKLREKVPLKPFEKDLIVTTNIAGFQKNHPRQPRAKYAGEKVQMDASQHLWFGDTKCFLHSAIDDATGRIIGAYFAPQETLAGYYQVLYQILKSEGSPAKFLTDKRTVFEYNRKKNPTDEQDTLTQFSYACSKLGCAIETSSIAQVKGRIERSYGTLQSRLLLELRLAGVTDIEAANEFLPKFVARFNERFALPADKVPSVFDKDITDEMINTTLAVVSERMVDNGNATKYENKYYQFYNSDGDLICIPPKTKCEVTRAFDGTLFASTCDKDCYVLKQLERNRKHSKEFDPTEEEEKPVQSGHKPSDTHPWGYRYYKERLWKKIATA